MEDSIIKKFDLQAGEAFDSTHWSYCAKNKIPYVVLKKAGAKYWRLEYDTASITGKKRFTIINYSDHIIPLYELYCKNVNLPINKKTYSGGGRSLTMTVLKLDAKKIANLLFDLLVELSVIDQEMFDDAPFYINEQGYNSEGYHVYNYAESLKKLSDMDLITEQALMIIDNPNMLQTLEIIKGEIDFRKLQPVIK